MALGSLSGKEWGLRPMLSEITLQELADILREDYCAEMNAQELFETAQGLVALFDTLHRFDFADSSHDKHAN